MKYESKSVKDGRQYDDILQLNQDHPLSDSRSSQQITAEEVAYQYDNVTPVKCDPLRQNVNSASVQELENEHQTRLSIMSLQKEERDELEPPDWSLNYQPDHYQEATASNISFSTRDLISWSLQIVRGMDYLVSKKVLHGDLAARNVLLNQNLNQRPTFSQLEDPLKARIWYRSSHHYPNQKTFNNKHSHFVVMFINSW